MPINFTEDGITASIRDEHIEKSSISVTEDGITIRVNEKQPINSFFPIHVIVSEIVTFFSKVIHLQFQSSMKVLQFLFPMILVLI